MIAAAVVDLALTCYRTPLAHQDRLAASAPLPAGMGALLALANGSQEELDEAVRHSGASPAELREAARFLVQQLCFARGASHYRVLGLEPEAPIEQIKEHYRQLIRLYHPDRAAGSETWTAGYAARVNEAWTVLSHPESRARYDTRMPLSETQLEPQTAELAFGTRPSPWSQISVGRRVRPTSRRPRSSRMLHVLRPRRLPMLVLGGCALLAALLVWSIRLVAPPAALPDDASTAAALTRPTPRSDPLPDPETKEAELERVREQQQRIEQRLKAEQTRLEGLRDLATKQAELDRVREQQLQTERRVKAEQTRLEGLRDLAARQAELERVREQQLRIERQLMAERARLGGFRTEQPAVTPPPPAPPSMRSAVVAAEDPPIARPKPTATVTPAIDHTPDDPGLTGRDVETLVERYINAFRRADLDSLMSLFSPGARGKDGKDRAGIHRLYEEQFGSFLILRLQFHDLSWDLHGDTASAVARYELRLRGRQDGQLNQWAGTVRLKLHKRAGRVLIQSVDYD
jgi:ketosteroid isomerase-like protein